MTSTQTRSGGSGRRVAQHTADSRHIEDTIVNELAQALLEEKRRARRWSIFFRFVLLAVLLLLLLLALSDKLTALFDLGGGRHTALIEISGEIALDQPASANAIISALQRALSHRNTAGVILRVNSPGGSPVQSGIVFDEILRLRNRYPEIPIHAVIGDVCASGAYYIAAAADRIYADKASVIGSIGVRMDSFGFEGTLEKLGVERRLLTTGENKALLDPFLPLDTVQVQHMQALLEQIHQQFVAAVRRGRGDRLENDPALFSGLIWSGEQALQKGLVDMLANEGHVAREVIGAERVLDFTLRPDVLESIASRLEGLLSAALNGRLGQTLPAPLPTPDLQ